MGIPNPLLNAIKSGAAPKMIKLAAAKGALPMPPDVLLESQVLLSRDSDAEVSALAVASLKAFPVKDLGVILESKEISGEVLDYFAVAMTHQQPLMEKILTNPATLPQTVDKVASRVSQSLAELIINNQVRLIEFPAIIQSLRSNPHLTPGNLTRIEEIERDFIGQPQAAAPAAAALPVEEAPPATPAAEPVIAFSTADFENFDQPTEPNPEVEQAIEELAEGDEEKLTLFQKISRLSVSDKIKVALLGKREERMLLIRDSNRLVSTSVLSSPKITESEIEVFSQLRNVSDEVLRLIGNNKEWTKNYKISFCLIKNPRAPIGVTMGLVSKLTTLDLKNLQRERQVPEGIRTQAKRVLSRRGV